MRVVDQLHTGKLLCETFLGEWFDIPLKTFSSHLFIHENDGAIEHLLRVSAGIDSMVLGETQILGQVRNSFLDGQTTVRQELFSMNYLNKLLHLLKMRMLKQLLVKMQYRFLMQL